jgi:hypothetical protein
MSVIDDLLAKEPEQRTVRFCLDAELRRALADAQARVRAAAETVNRTAPSAKGSARESLEAAEEKAAELLAEARENTVTFVFGAVPPEQFKALRDAHPPTDEEKRRAKAEDAAEPEWSASMQPEFVAAACVQVKGPSGTADGISVEDARRIWSSPSYNVAERGELFNAALAATLTRTNARVDG